MKNNLTALLSQLISIPSWVDKQTNEAQIGIFICNFLTQNRQLKINKQSLGNGRYNLFASNSNQVDNLIVGHMDTVQPNSGWTREPTKPQVIGDKLYGLGSSDMKGGLAVILKLATSPALIPNTGFLFYCDEEYDFLGMREFIKEYSNKIAPKLIVSLDGEGPGIGNSCRGLIEMKVKVRGQAGHAANPKSGVNAITESFVVINQLKTWLKTFKSPELGVSTLNIARINGGSKQGNIIAETCEYIVEVRVADNNLNAKKVKDFIVNQSLTRQLKVDDIIIRHDLGSWITPKRKLLDILNLAPSKNLKQAKKRGYLDVQMLWKSFKQPRIFTFGVGTKNMSHKADEYVQISNLQTAEKFMTGLLSNNGAC